MLWIRILPYGAEIIRWLTTQSMGKTALQLHLEGTVKHGYKQHLI